MSACMPAFLDFQQGDFGSSGQTYFDWEVEQTSHISTQMLIAVMYLERIELLIKRFAILVKRVGFFVMLWLNKDTIIQIQLSQNNS